MIEFSTNQFIYQLEQNTIINSDCILRIFDKEYNLIKQKNIPIKLLSDFLLSITYK